VADKKQDLYLIDIANATPEEIIDLKNELQDVLSLALSHAFNAIDQGVFVECFHKHLFHALETAKRNAPCEYCGIVEVIDRGKEGLH
jgi:hypothetical protein